MCIRSSGKSIKDHIAHLTAWINFVLDWYKKNGKPDFNFKDTPKINEEIDKKYEKISLSKALSDFKKAHTNIIDIIKKHTDKELFTKKLYAWTGSTSIGSYFVSATSSHYDWALKKFKLYRLE